MNEDFIQYIWKHQLIFPGLTTTTGEILNVLKTGEQNSDSGPDFFNGRIRLGTTTWAGNIEIHLKSSDWFLHHHQDDPAYENIILHVVYTDDKPIYRNSSEPIPTLELKNSFDKNIFTKYDGFLKSEKWIPCENLINSVGHFQKFAWLDNLMVERLDQKAGLIEKELLTTENNLQEVFYRKLAGNFGFKTNSETFEFLAKSLPLKIQMFPN
jgi:hypothetical protein